MRASCVLIFFAFYFPLDLVGQGFPSSSILETPITLSVTEKPLKFIFREITLKYNIEFSYSTNILNDDHITSLKAQETPLYEVLELLAENKAISYDNVKGRVVFRKSPAPLVQTVRGIITDHGTKAPISGTSVFIIGTEPVLGTVSDDDGYFKIKNVPIGRQDLHFSHVGYESVFLSSLLIGAGKEIVLAITLSDAGAYLEEVVISEAKSSKQNTHANILSKHPLKIREAKRYASSLNDPARMVSSAPGVSGDDFMENAIVIRGNSSRGLLWRIEGIDLPNPNHFSEEGSSAGGVSIISANMLDNSRLLTGAFPAKYGNALSGVLDLKLRKGNHEKKEYTLQAGTMGLDLSMEGPFKKGKTMSYLVNYRYSSFSLLDKVGFDFSPSNTATRFQDLAFNLILPSKNYGTFSVFGIGGVSGYSSDSLEMNREHTSKMGIIGILNDFQINNTCSLQSSFSFSGTGNRSISEFQPITSSNYTYEEKFNKSFARASVALQKKLSSSFLLEAGLSYNRLSYNFRDNVTENQSSHPQRNFSYFNDKGTTGLSQAYMNIQSTLGKKWQLNTGMHIIHFALNNNTSYEPRASIAYKTKPDHNVYAAFGLHSRIEPLQYYFAHYSPTDSTKSQYNRNLGFAKSLHYVLGYSFAISANSLLKIEGYYQDLYNIPIQNDSLSFFSSIAVYEGFSNIELYNEGQAKNYGVELSLEKRFSKNYYLSWNGALYNAKYETQNSKERYSPYNGSFNTHLLAGKEFSLGHVSNKNRLSLNLRAVWKGGKRYVPIDLNKSKTMGFEVLEFTNAYADQLDDYKRLDLQITYRYNLPKYTGEWRLDFFNITGERNITRLYYDIKNQDIGKEIQLGAYPVLSYRMEF